MTTSSRSRAEAALAALPPFEPVPTVGYQSAGRLLVLGGDQARVLAVVEALKDTLSLALFDTDNARVSPPGTESRRGRVVALHGFLGAFDLLWQRDANAPTEQAAFDLVLDLQDTPAFSMAAPPQGYFRAAPGDDEALQQAFAALPDMVGEFEKPKFFSYKESICAHSRSQREGCHRCIDICSTAAITSAGDTVSVDPHLCMGCGACATVCPSGAMAYQFPRVADRGAQLRTMLAAWREGGNTVAPIIVVHNETDGAEAVRALADEPNVLCLPAWHVASVGMDVMLGALAYGAAGLAVITEGSETPEYRAALTHEAKTADIIANALGFGGTHFVVGPVGELKSRLAALASAQTVATPAGFHLTNDKRTTLEFAVEFLARNAPQLEEIPLDAPAMFGLVVVNEDRCTMCLACAGACPESALMDGGPDAMKAQLRFLERNCVQCGLCASTCPESAISLKPRLLLTPERKKEVVLNESTPFDCISCGKVLGTKKLIDNMLGKLAGHSMFQTPGSLKRLQMCADCRVVDMMSNKNEISVLTGRPME